MIQSTRGRTAAQIARGEAPRRFPPELVRAAQRKMAMLDAASTLNDLRSPPGNRLEALHGNRGGQHSVRINDQWRICFRWTEDGPEDVEIVDYH